MVYHITKVLVYIFSICLAMYGLNCIQFDNYIKKGKIKEFYVLYILLSVVIGYLFASFILDFTLLSLSGY